MDLLRKIRQGKGKARYLHKLALIYLDMGEFDLYQDTMNNVIGRIQAYRDMLEDYS